MMTPWCELARCATARANLELARGPLGSARPSIGRRLTLKANAMGLSSRLFLLFADDTPHVLGSAAFTRMIRREHVARVPDFAGQRVRQACIVVELVNGTPFACLRVLAFRWFDEFGCRSNGGLVQLTERDRSPRVHRRHST